MLKNYVVKNPVKKGAFFWYPFYVVLSPQKVESDSTFYGMAGFIEDAQKRVVTGSRANL